MKNAKNIAHQIPHNAFAYARIDLSPGSICCLCLTCRKYLKQGEIPPYSIANGLHFWPQPPELMLHPLEGRLLALRMPFMQIQELPRGGQLSLKGNVVNVPANVPPVVTSLPRTLDDCLYH